VTGRVSADRAPILVRAWRELDAALTDEWQAVLPLAVSVATAADCSISTVRNLIAAGNRGGVVQVRRRRGGTPVRARAEIRRRLDERPNRPTPDPRGDLS
jgi:hypothetical protein